MAVTRRESRSVQGDDESKCRMRVRVTVVLLCSTPCTSRWRDWEMGYDIDGSDAD